MTKVLFVCLGNICRSPMAEAVFRHQVKEAGLADKIEIDSAGTGDWHVGERPHKGTLAKMAEYGISTEGMHARQITAEDGQTYDYIVAMDDSNMRNMMQVFPQTSATVLRLLDVIDDALTEVPDPYYTGDFAQTYDLVERASKALLKKIIREQGLL
ncbi:MAG TPA: low molecular weight phosphotyrosine protein phosphatase [Metalysinibacillus jejuensis]|uniref:protein-tyrosine-phosphatase n=1 Tax=Metalysinibacillus jejuensis TaxID=914327 RepID=A0A921NAN7_9BACL|nr:low molecular weight protein-tyrosine-phosphatase [Metalysinibacillus jejuensis]HJH10612.1 low molecular weight phosphotyrosine protein phosphatase [Metalysinibacillus jejuensis]